MDDSVIEFYDHSTTTFGRVEEGALFRLLSGETVYVKLSGGRYCEIGQVSRQGTAGRFDTVISVRKLPGEREQRRRGMA